MRLPGMTSSISFGMKILPSSFLTEDRIKPMPRWMRLPSFGIAFNRYLVPFRILRAALHIALRRCWVALPSNHYKVISGKAYLVDGCLIMHPALHNELMNRIPLWGMMKKIKRGINIILMRLFHLLPPIELSGYVTGGLFRYRRIRPLSGCDISGCVFKYCTVEMFNDNIRMESCHIYAHSYGLSSLPEIDLDIPMPKVKPPKELASKRAMHPPSA